MGARPANVERLAEAALGVTVRAVEPTTAGRMAATYLLELDGNPGRAVCKVGGPSVRTGDVVEPLVVRLVGATTDLPVPAVLSTGQVHDRTGTRRHWALYEFCDGHAPTEFDTLASAPRRRVLREVGSALGRLHATHRFERTGGLARTDGDVGEESHAGTGRAGTNSGADGQAHVSGDNRQTLTGGDLRICDPRGLHVPESGRRLLRRAVGPDGVDPQPVLTHGDLFPGNLLVAPDGSVTALLDWGNAHVTTAGYALARAEMRFVDWFRFPAGERERLRGALRAGYRTHRSLPPDYPRFGSLYKLLWLVQSGERHLRHALTSRGRRQLRDHLGSVLADVTPE
jgi:serine/threonine protein kinase